MKITPPLVDMARTTTEKEEAAVACLPDVASQPNYPWGLSISLCDEELDKLGVDYNSIETGAIVHMHCLAVVTAKSSNAVQGTEPSCRIELQITHIAAEDEDEEDDEAEPAMKAGERALKKLYN